AHPLRSEGAHDPVESAPTFAWNPRPPCRGIRARDRVEFAHRSSVTIEGLSEIAGGVPKGVLKEALAWAAAHQDELRATWKELNP
ncbi:DUF4160 domain-containing protein, partial [Phenylobacterium sp.]|uniref:DUF4160 domain-containing protein n=1 Tax=Phenylobacterium sp. TaxID=1871053 RepID=UPI00391C0A08